MTLYISPSRAAFAARQAGLYDRFPIVIITPRSRIAADRSRESGWSVAAYRRGDFVPFIRL